MAGTTTAPAQASAFPAWANELAEKYRGGTIVEFLIHGNVHDLVREDTSRGERRFVPLKDFLASQVFPQRDAVVFYDVSSGISFRDEETFGDFHRVAQAVDAASGTSYASSLPRDPRRALYLIERFLRAKVDPRGGVKPKSAAVVIDYAHLIVPAGDPGRMGPDEQAVLVTLLRWANDAAFLKADLTIVLIAENLAELNGALVKSPYIGRVEIRLPDDPERHEFLEHCFRDMPALGKLAKIDAKGMARLTAGLSRVNLKHLTAQAVKNEREITQEFVGREKKELIEKECYGLLEFLAPRYTMEMVSGHEAQKRWLDEDARLIREGRVDALPMGYLICGPVGTGKTFLIQCYTGSIGIPCVKLLNFRSQWQGVTEGNWEKILNVLKATGPVGVIIDEADAALGQRDSSGDSGTSSRVFSMLAQQMGDTRYRGFILWFLLTCRPDILPIDLKRQGRAEVHIPLFYPDEAAERRGLFRIMSKKVGARLAEPILKALEPKAAGDATPVAESPLAKLDMSRISGADVEGLLVRAKRRAYLAGREEIQPEDLDVEIAAFLPPQYPEEIELQVLAAVLECTDKRFLPGQYRDADRMELAHRFKELQAILE